MHKMHFSPYKVCITSCTGKTFSLVSKLDPRVLLRLLHVQGSASNVLHQFHTHYFNSLLLLSLSLSLSPPPVVEALVDQHGRRYYMDHNTRTIAYEEEQRQTLGGEPDMQARREMLNRR